MAMKAKSPAEESFAKKVALLENAVLERKIPSEWPSISKITDLRDWESEPLGLTCWKSNSIHARSGPYAPIRARFEAVLPLFLEILQGSNIKKNKRRTDVEKILRDRVKRLAIQNEGLILQVQKLDAKLATAEERLARAQRKLKAIVPIAGPVRDA